MVKILPRVTYIVLCVFSALVAGCFESGGAVDDTDTDATEASGNLPSSTGTATRGTDGSGSSDTPTTNADETGTDATSSATEGPPGIDAARALLEPLVAAECQRAFDCCDTNELAYQIGPAVTDSDDCTQRTLDVLASGGNAPYLEGSSISLSGLLPLFAFGLDPSEFVLDEKAFAACVAAIEARPCASAGSAGEENCVPPEVTYLGECDLNAMFIGQREFGEFCQTYRGLECGPGLRCDFYGAAGGVCVETLSDGDNCFNDFDCLGDLICDYGTGTCAAPAGPGEPCAYPDAENPQIGTASPRCRDGLTCDPLAQLCGSAQCAFGNFCNDDFACPVGLSCVASRCDLLAEPGEDCFTDEQCAAGRCVYNGFASVCQALVPNGGACGDSPECASGFCHPVTAQCALQTPLDQPCDNTLPNAQCAGGYCDGVNCVAFAAIGEDCTATPCDSQNEVVCWNGTCQSFPLPNGQTCTFPGECQSEVCNTTCQPAPAIGDPCIAAACGGTAYCDIPGGRAEGTCAAPGSRGAPCVANAQCWGGCVARFGEERCAGQAPGEAFCDGM